MQSSPSILIAVLCGFFLILAGMVTFVIYTARKKSAREAKIAQALGLTPVLDSQELLQKVAYVNDINRPDLYCLEHVFHHLHASGEDVYLFSLYGAAGRRRSHSHRLELNALAFVSQAWHLPRFSARPYLSGGKLDGIYNRLSEAAVGIKQEVIKFPHIPMLDESYLIGTLDMPLQDNLPDGFLQVLAANPNLFLHGGRDILTLSYHDYNDFKFPNEEMMKQLYKIGMQLARELYI